MFDDIKNDNGGDSASEGGVTSKPPAHKQNEQMGDLIGETVVKTPAAPESQAKTTQAIETKPDAGSGAPASRPAAEDIFAKTESTIPQSGPKPDALKPKNPGMPPVSPEQIDRVEVADDGSSKKKIMLIVFLILFVAIIAYGSYWTYTSFFGGKSNGETVVEPEVNNTTEDNNSMQSNETGSNDVQNNSLPPKTEAPLDSDNDGLLDSEEESLGTDILRVDSDDDGLYDREEVKVYKTDPLNPDTDGDGYTDGDEVDQNYNPLGPGKLYQLE